RFPRKPLSISRRAQVVCDDLRERGLKEDRLEIQRVPLLLGCSTLVVFNRVPDRALTTGHHLEGLATPHHPKSAAPQTRRMLLA
ncbi:hypothetical protein HMPREF0298_0022, partial [Corynebacterium lipophiloflavum DSM 44291]